MNLLDLTGKRILITGALGAIGRIVVKCLTEHGALVFANDLLPPREAGRMLTDLGVAASAVVYYECDCREPEAVLDMLQACERAYGLPHVVCCHAGLVRPGPINSYSLRDFDDTLDLNLRSSFVVSQAAVQAWRRKGLPGHLIFTTSWVQDVPWPEIAAYTVSKSGMRTLMRGMAREMAPEGIRANAVAPGIVGVGMARKQWDEDPSYRHRAGKAIPLGELQTPESVAHAFLYLCSDMASYMTGSVLLVDGGCSLYPMD